MSRKAFWSDNLPVPGALSRDIPGQQNLFDEAEMEQDPSLPEEETVIREHTRKKKTTHDELFKGLKVEK